MDLIEQSNKYYITFDLIKKSLNDFEELKKEKELIKIDKIIEFFEKFEYLYNLVFTKNLGSFLLLKRNIIFFKKNVVKKKSIKLKKIKYANNNQVAESLYCIIPIIKIFINKKNHKNIQKIFIILIKLIIDKILPYEVFTITIEFILIYIYKFIEKKL